MPKKKMGTHDIPQVLGWLSLIRVYEHVAGRLDEVFKRCYARRDRRFGSAFEMLEAMRPAKPGRASPPSPPPLPAGMVHADATGLKCPACRCSVLRTDNFCIRCRHQLVASVPKCRHCGEFVQHGDRFCIRCGKNLTVMS